MNRCPECRTRRVSFKSLLVHIAKSGHKVCNCGGYHYAHRPMSPFCEKHPMQELHEAIRRGADKAELLDVEIECMLNKPGRVMKGWK